MTNRRHALQTLASSALLAAVGPAFAGPGHDKPHGPVKKEQTEWGIAGDAKSAKRTVQITMLDTMRFSPHSIAVRLGETIRFRMKNTGMLGHELVIGTQAKLDEHAALMAKFPTMEHDEPYMAHVGSKASGDIVWTFNRAGNFGFACLIPGHYQAGMVGKITVAAK
nr:cupredoxin family protein [uncultured Albidiferax sp.]